MIALGKGHKVELSRPDAVICVEVLSKVAGVSVIPDNRFAALHKFNMRILVEEGIKDLSKVVTKAEATAAAAASAAAAAAAAAATSGAVKK